MNGKRNIYNCIALLVAVSLLLTACGPATAPDTDTAMSSIPADAPSLIECQKLNGDGWCCTVVTHQTKYNDEGGVLGEVQQGEDGTWCRANSLSGYVKIIIGNDSSQVANFRTSEVRCWNLTVPAAVAQAPIAISTPVYNPTNPEVLAAYSGGVLLTKGAVTKALKRWGDVYPVRFNAAGRVGEVGLVLATNRDASIVVQHIPRPGEGGMGEITVAGGQWRTLDPANKSDQELVANSTVEVSTASYYTPPGKLESLRYRWHVWEDRYPLGAGALKAAYASWNIVSLASLGAGLAGAGIGAVMAMGADDAANLVAKGVVSTIDDVALNYSDDAAKAVLLNVDDLAPYLDDAGRVALNGMDDAGGVWVENNLDDFLTGLLGTADDVGDDAGRAVLSQVDNVADDIADDVATQTLQRPQLLARTSPQTGEMVIPDAAARAMGLSDDALGLRVLNCPPCPQGQARVLLYRSSLGGIGVFPVGREVAITLGAGDDVGMLLSTLMAGDERALTIVGLANLDRVNSAVASQGWSFVSSETKRIPLLGALGTYFSSETWHWGP